MLPPVMDKSCSCRRIQHDFEQGRETQSAGTKIDMCSQGPCLAARDGAVCGRCDVWTLGPWAEEKKVVWTLVMSRLAPRRQTPEVDVLTLGVACLSSATWWKSDALMMHYYTHTYIEKISRLVNLTPDSLRYHRCSMELLKEACWARKPWASVVPVSCRQHLRRT